MIALLEFSVRAFLRGDDRLATSAVYGSVLQNLQGSAERVLAIVRLATVGENQESQ